MGQKLGIILYCLQLILSPTLLIPIYIRQLYLSLSFAKNQEYMQI